MPFASNTTTASGASGTAVVPFPYLDQSHVHVTVDGVQVDDNLLVFISPGLIQLPTTPTAGQTVVVYRTTPEINLLDQIVDGQFIDDVSINQALTQLLYISQENSDLTASVNSSVGGIVTTAQDAAASASESATAAAASAASVGTEASAAAASAASAAASAVLAASFSGASVAPVDADYLVKTTNGALSAERVVTDGTWISWVWTVAGQVSAILVDGSITLAKLATAAFASEAEAEAGIENTKIVTSLRVQQAIVAYLAANPVSGNRTGSLRPTHCATAEAGWLLWNDGTIGDASSNATSRANADTAALFAIYYNGYSDTLCPLFTGAGASTTRVAQGDATTAYAAHCAVRLPLGMGRLVGVAGAGAGLTSRTLGVTAGAESTAIAVTNLPSHDHPMWVKGGSANKVYEQIYVINADTGSQDFQTIDFASGAHAKDIGTGLVIGATGSGTALGIMNPAAYTNWEIKL